jgi:septum site-determining protein MinC
MAANPKSSPGEIPAAFELKAAGFTLPIVRLLDGNMDAVAEQLGVKVEQAPDFFRNTPVVIDLSAFPEGAGEVEFPLLVGLLRGYGMIPFGVRGGNKIQNAAAEAMELAVLGDAFARAGRPPGSAPTPPSAAAGPGSVPPANGVPDSLRRANPTFTMVTRPVRSGQRIYAAGGDLSVVAPVSSGAELMADGNIHVYGPLRGRALAGMKGNADARIFCQDLQAELVSVAGHYRVSENIPADLRGVPVQVYLDQKILRIERL